MKIFWYYILAGRWKLGAQRYDGGCIARIFCLISAHVPRIYPAMCVYQMMRVYQMYAAQMRDVCRAYATHVSRNARHTCVVVLGIKIHII